MLDKLRLGNLFLCIFGWRFRISWLEVPYTMGNGLKTQFIAWKVEDFQMKNWIKYDENSSSDARRGHLRTSKLPNFSKGERFPLWPPLSLRRRRWVSLCGIRARQLAIFFTVCQLLDCGIVSLNYDVFILGLPLHNIPKYIYFDPDGCVTPSVAHGGTYLKQYLKHEGGIVEKSFAYPFSFIFWRGTRFLYLESAYGCVCAK